MLGWKGGGGGEWLGKHLLRRDDLYHLRFQPNRNSKLQAFFGKRFRMEWASLADV